MDQLAIELDAFPSALRPMQAVVAEAPFSSEEYFFEVKWDGLRCLLFAPQSGGVHLQDRALHEVGSDLVPALSQLAAQVEPGTVLDGELVATDGRGKPDRDALRARLEGGHSSSPLAFLASDLLYSRGRSLLRWPLARRKAQLARVVHGSGNLFVPDHIEGDGEDLFDACLERGLGGIVAKHRDSTYVPGQRSPFWLEVEAVKRDPFVVIGATPGSPFGALLVGYQEDGNLLPCGAVGGGFDDHSYEVLAAGLDRLTQDECPLHPAPVVTAPVRWCRPELVINVRYSEWAQDGTLRFPIFGGVRGDVHPAECVRRRPRVVVEGRVSPGTPAYDLARFPF